VNYRHFGIRLILFMYIVGWLLSVYAVSNIEARLIAIIWWLGLLTTCVIFWLLDTA
jgi:hypothetical protein